MVETYHSRAYTQSGVLATVHHSDSHKTGASTHPVWTNSGSIPAPPPLLIQAAFNEVAIKLKLYVVELLPPLPVAIQDLNEPIHIMLQQETNQYRIHQKDTPYSYLDPDCIGKSDGNS